MPDYWSACRLRGEKSHKGWSLLRVSHKVSLGLLGVARCWKWQHNGLILRPLWYTYHTHQSKDVQAMKNISPSCFTFLLPSCFLLSPRAFLPEHNFPRAFHFHQVITINQNIKCGSQKGRAQTILCKAEQYRFTAFHPRNYCFPGFIIWRESIIVKVYR